MKTCTNHLGVVLAVVLSTAFLGACSKPVQSGELDDLKAERLDLLRLSDRLKKEAAATTEELERFEKRILRSGAEQKHIVDSSSEIRDQYALLQEQLETLRENFDAYKKNCQVGTLDLTTGAR